MHSWRRTGGTLALAAALAVAGALGPVAAQTPGPAEPPAALATGDSMMQVIELTLERRLEALGLATTLDSRVGSGISKPGVVDWVTLARTQASELRPGLVIVFLGANDVYPLRSGGRMVRCCGPGWVDAYAARARRMLSHWTRGGSGRVYWMTLPTPRDRGLARVHHAVNRAVRRAAGRAGEGVRVIELAGTLTPHRRYRAAMRWNGRRVRVRVADGVHLTRAGAGIATDLVVRALRADGLIP